MKFAIRHEISGRIRFHVMQQRMSSAQADTLLYYLRSLEYVTQATVYERTADAVSAARSVDGMSFHEVSLCRCKKSGA